MALRVVKVTPGRLVGGRFVPVAKNPKIRYYFVAYPGGKIFGKAPRAKAWAKAQAKFGNTRVDRVTTTGDNDRVTQTIAEYSKNPEKKTRAGIRAKKRRFREMLKAARGKVKNPSAAYDRAQKTLFRAQARAYKADDAFQAALDKAGENRYQFKYKSKSVTAAKRRFRQAADLVHRLTQKMRSLA